MKLEFYFKYFFPKQEVPRVYAGNKFEKFVKYTIDNYKKRRTVITESEIREMAVTLGYTIQSKNGVEYIDVNPQDIADAYYLSTMPGSHTSEDLRNRTRQKRILWMDFHMGKRFN